VFFLKLWCSSTSSRVMYQVESSPWNQAYVRVRVYLGEALFITGRVNHGINGTISALI